MIFMSDGMWAPNNEKLYEVLALYRHLSVDPKDKFWEHSLRRSVPGTGDCLQMTRTVSPNHCPRICQLLNSYR